MKYKIEITANTRDQWLLYYEYFNSLEDLTKKFYELIKSYEYAKKYKNCILTTYKVYIDDDGNEYQEETRMYFHCFPEYPKEENFKCYRKQEEIKETNINIDKIKNVTKTITGIIIIILMFPIWSIFATCKEKK